MDILQLNRTAWNHQVARGNRWTIPATPEVIAAARRGQWEIVLTPSRPVPRAWFPPLEGCRVLCLASGGGQQGPVLAAAGARVTVFDLSPAQLGQDRLVAQREGLDLTTVEGDMADLEAFADQTFDLVFHPCSNCFVPQVRPVWREAFRVLRPGGVLLAGFVNPVWFLFDEEKGKAGVLEARHTIPYSDLTSLDPAERQRYLDRQEPLMFGHTLEDQVGGQLEAGFLMTGFFEDSDPDSPVSRHLQTFIATRSVKV